MAESINRVLAQPKQRPSLANLKRVCPQDLAHCEGYVWHLGTRIGKGSFGEVYLGWSSDGTKEVAVKVVRKEFFRQDPKVRENLEREIRILKLLRGCEYVVHLYHVQELKQHIVLVMELCEFDLDHLVKIKPFKEQDIIIFLYQLAQGMKALREQNIVHRDLKPGNILIKRHPTTGKMMIKLADFGFARHFKDEGMKPIDMTSLAGTPVFMAPEALRCVFHPGEHYDDKVDIWSIGALLYKVIVGQCGFYAQLQDIPRILKKKGDAIAFERIPRSAKINFIYELPAVVNDRLSEPFREKMNKLLRAMLKLDPAERMMFSEFFVAVDDIITSKIEISNLLHGTSMKVMNDPELTIESLANEIFSYTHIPPQHQVLFSNSSQYFISPHSTLSPEHFSQLLEESGGTRGHAKLYLLPINLVESDTLTPDYSCLADLSFVLDDQRMCVSQIVDHKLSDEMVHMIHNMSAQQKSQLEGLKELCTFVSREVALFGSHGYKQLSEMGHQALAKANLAIQWLQQDLSSLPDRNQSQMGALLQAVNQHQAMIKKLVQELDGFNSSTDISANIDVKEEVLVKTANFLSEDCKVLPKLRMDEIHSKCKQINDSCQQLISDVTEKVKKHLHPVWTRLSLVWRLNQTSEGLSRECSGLDRVLEQVSVERSTVLRSLSGGAVQATLAQGGGVNSTPPPLMVTPPGASMWTSGPFPGPTPPMGTWGAPPSSPIAVEAIEREKVDLQNQVERLTAELHSLRMSAGGRQRNSSSGGFEEEQTIRPGAAEHLRPHSPSDVENTMRASSTNEASIKTLQSLNGQLKQFCSTAERLKPGITAEANQPRTPSTPQGGGALYPSLADGYAIISSPEVPDTGSNPPLPDNVDALLPKALQLAELLKANAENIVKTSARGTVTVSANSGLVKIGRPLEYREGDIVIFNHFKLIQSRGTIPVILHLERPRPFMLMDSASLENFTRQGKMPDLILGKLLENPRKLRFEDHPTLAEDFGSSSGEFFRVRAEPTLLKFSAPHVSTQVTPTNPPPPSPGKTDKKKHISGFFRSSHKKGGGFV